MAEVRQSNPKAFEQMDFRLKELEKYSTRVGWFEDKTYEDGTPVAYIASIQEFGHGAIPARPFMRPAYENNREKWRKIAEDSAKKVLDGTMTAKASMDLLGVVAQEDIADAIIAVNAPPLSPLTILARKYRKVVGSKIPGAATLGALDKLLKSGKADLSGVSTKPLQDTGQMLADVSFITESTK